MLQPFSISPSTLRFHKTDKSGATVSFTDKGYERRQLFSPDVKEVLVARRILEAMPDGTGVAMIDGKMQDDATWKQAKVIVDLARLLAKKDPELAQAYGF